MNTDAKNLRESGLTLEEMFEQYSTSEEIFESYSSSKDYQTTYRENLVNIIRYHPLDSTSEQAFHNFMFNKDSSYRVFKNDYMKPDHEVFLPAIVSNIFASSEFLLKLYLNFEKNYDPDDDNFLFQTEFLMLLFGNMHTPEQVLISALNNPKFLNTSGMIECFYARGFGENWPQEWIEAQYGVKLYNLDEVVAMHIKIWKQKIALLDDYNKGV